MKMGDMKIPVALTVNGEEVVADVEPRTSLADFLREQLRLTAIHLGCEHGVCGACTVLINGTPARSCIALAVALEGADVRTLEGLAADPVMRTIKDAFHQEHGLQCGFCTPGMLITAWDLMKIMPDPRRRRGAGRNQRQSLPLYRVPGDRALDPASGRGGADLPAARGGLSPPPAAPQAKRTPFPLRFRFVPGSIPQCPADAAEASPNLVFQCSAGRREAYFRAHLRKHAFHKASNHISYSPRIFAPPRRAIHHGGFAPRQSESTNGCCQSWPRYAQASGGKVG